MDIKTHIQQQIEHMRGQVDAAMQDTTDEQFNWTPPGTLNPISAIFLHMVTAEDDFIQTVIGREPPLWEAQEWSVRTGVETPPGPLRGWNGFKNAHVGVAQLRLYEQTVRAATDHYLAQATEKELERRVILFGRDVPVTEVLMVLVVHSATHAGEIAAIKGMQGVKGFPY